MPLPLEYQRNVNRLADLMELARHSPLEDAVWLVEYVSRTRGAEHLKISSRRLNLMQYLLLDVALFVAVSIFLAYIVCKKLGQRMCSLRKSRKYDNLEDKKNN